MSLRYLTAGESHGPQLLAILEGLPAGLKIDLELINHELKRRQTGIGTGPRMQKENDTAQLLSGVMAGFTTGGPVSILIENKDHENWQGKSIAPLSRPRPGHADLTGALKFAHTDLQLSLERASARETAIRTAVGALCKQYLACFGVQVFGYVTAIGPILANVENIPLQERAALAESNLLRCPDLNTVAAMESLVKEVTLAKDTLGGRIEVIATGVPIGLGSYTQGEKRLASRLGAALLGVQAVQGVEIGDGFANSQLQGTQVQDSIYLEGDKIIRKTNHAGGIEGGISNGQAIRLQAAMKPIASTLTPQASIDLLTAQEAPTNYIRSDFCPVPRAVPILEAVTAIVLAEALLEKLGGDSIKEQAPRFDQLRKMQLSDIQIDPHQHTWWPD